MLKILTIVMFISINIFALSLSGDDKYKVYEDKKLKIVYTEDYKNEAVFIKENIQEFMNKNDKSFSYTFDDQIKIVLISNDIQVPNAFSTQVPYNMGVYFNGGSVMNNYFATKSWLITLFTHEMIHNYQTNAKKSKISKTLNKYLGNNFMPVFAIAPFFTLPNILLPTALLEGNSVLNESLYGNGGRLYSGRLNALKNTLVLNDKITANSFINDHLDFPYTQEKYIVGGFYMEYLVYRYGLDKVNSFFYENSIHSINPLLLDITYKKHFGLGFEKSIDDFVKYTKDKYSDFKELESKDILAFSKDEVYLSKIGDKIYYITSDLIANKQLNIYNTNTYNNTNYNTTLSNGKIFLLEDKIYTASNNFIGSSIYKHGLFDESDYIKASTKGKSIQDIYKEKTAYIDVNRSFSETKLYINDNFYTNISSNALFDKSGNIYYFKQIDNKRVLFKNKKKIYSFVGYYSKLVDIVDDEVYFISKTKNGSTLYKYSNKNLYKLINSDNIINAKIIDKNSAITVTVTSESYTVQKTIFDKSYSNIYAKKRLNETSFKFKKEKNLDIVSKNYNELSQLEFSNLYPSYSYDSVEGSSYILNAMFIDPIMYNMINLYAFKNKDDSLQGFRYINERYIPFKVNIYNINRKYEHIKERGYGTSLEVYGSLWRKGRHELDISISKYFDDANKDKQPNTLFLNHTYQENFSLEDSPYFLSDLSLLAKEDRGDTTFGANYFVNKHLFSEIYVNFQAKSLQSNTSRLIDQRGIEIVTDPFDTNDITNVLIEGSDNDFFVKDITKLSIGLSKTFHLSSYFSKFPISLRKESIFYRHNQFDFTTSKTHTINESIFGIKFDTLFFHKLSLPVVIKYIENDKSIDDYKIKASIGVTF